MKLSAATVLAAQAVVGQEALHLDAQRWDDWLALFTDDVQFWVPAWTDEHTLGASPESELSLVYITARAGLEDRVWRVRSGLSVASTVLPRTCHQVTNCVVAPASEGELRVESSWSCHQVRLKDRSQHVFFGRYEHRLREVDGQWRIAGKKVVLLNDVIPTMLDFYCI
ncbi:aromatic-ring-hydroxylating dioxygenase subunit beta [Ramlibacter sp. USB13]|uniref:Aromatic-ring-hydroxylating dioxygenase subunit beta n=1 Tax=Ramlibacter cellulosilyticus TaxID=2764187 RepID=A0A923SG74_9BURK|nr:aromatic-ring-hydroxylating dioxygenase subunit beta [Ramlibacter cellulosilyticus]MBC5784647.1 aromatic-ring-hydroxylating dioxygenase subunit beta [Ramlibacter cellulosilyticus]